MSAERDTFYTAWIEFHGEQQWLTLVDDDFDSAPLLFERRQDLIDHVDAYSPAMVLRKVVPVHLTRLSLQPLAAVEEKT